MATPADLATNNAIAILEKSLKAAQPGSKEQTDLSIALYNLKKEKEKNSKDTVNDTKTKKSDTDNDKNVVSGSNASAPDPTQRQWNPLSLYSSATYKLSLYAIAPDAIQDFSKTGKWNLKLMKLLMQSGGRTNGVDAERAKYFDLDMYIDNLEITTVLGTKETGNASTSYDFRFQIFEPYGFSFVSRLITAVSEMQSLSSTKHEVNQPVHALQTDYMLAIHFYGYDSEGNISNGPPDASGHVTGVAGGAAFERMFPIRFYKMSSRLDAKTTIYDCSAYSQPQQVGFSSARAIMPEAMTVNAATVKEALDLTASILNQKQILKSGTDDKFKQEIPDEFEFVFDSSGAIDNALIVDKNHYVVGNAPMPEVTGPLGINVRLSDSGKSEVVTKQKRAVQFPNGMTMLKVIEQLISQSTFLSDALKVVDKEELQTVSKGDTTADANAAPKPLYWYHVTPQSIPKGWDHKRNEMAYKVRYIIQRKEIPYIRAVAATNVTSYPGAHKRYEYYYTGKNTEILSYEQTYNLLYFVTDPGSSESGASKSKEAGTIKNLNVSEASGAGRLPGANEQASTIMTSLYSPGDNILATIKILGDPDFLMTSESGTVDTITKKWYGDDYSINPAGSQVFIEVGFNQATDYDTELGLMEPNDRIFFWDYPEDIKKKTKNAMIYMVIIVKSKFSKGIFTQELKTVLPPFFGDGKKDDGETRTAQTGPTAAQQKQNERNRLDAIYKGQTAAKLNSNSKPKVFQSLISDQAGNDLIVKKPTGPIVPYDPKSRQN